LTSARETPSLLILGTDTGVGKTVVTALLTRALAQHGVDVAPFKPVASGVALRHEERIWEDTSFLAAAAGVPEDAVGMYRLAEPLSPHLAARIDGVRIDLDAIAGRVSELRAGHDCVLVEGVGGVMVPLTDRVSFLDLAAALDLPAVLVARPGLGTLNHTQLTVEALRNAGVYVAGLIVCAMPAHPSAAESTAPAELERLTRVPLLGIVPHIDGLDVRSLDVKPLDAHLEAVDLWRLRLPTHDHARALADDRDHVWHPFTPMNEYLAEKPHPLMIVKGRGSVLVDSEGNEYIDGVSSLWVTLHGHRTPRLDAAIREQLGRIAHSTLLGLANEPSALLAGRLVDIAPEGLTRVFYSDSGSTAVEVGLKIAFQYWKQSGRPQKREFVALCEGYHGDTIGSVSLGGIGLFHRIFEALLFDVHHIPTPYCYRCPLDERHPECRLRCLDALEDLLAEKAGSIAAFVVEPRVQGAAGMLVQPLGWLARAAALCREHDVLLICDEVATGFGRTGTMFACESENTRPDIMAVAKGITGGYLPLAATLVTEQIYGAFLGRPEEARTFFHGHTYTGNPLACAAAIANLDLFEENDVIAGVRQRTARLAELLEPVAALPHVGEVRQAGMMVGVELVRDVKTRGPFDPASRVGRQVILAAREEGVIIRPLGDVVVLMPPLAISEADLECLVGTTARAIGRAVARHA
jgi:adenosylmethionine-8-amino-7-oxononanoate aminotransferase